MMMTKKQFFAFFFSVILLFSFCTGSVASGGKNNVFSQAIVNKQPQVKKRVSGGKFSLFIRVWENEKHRSYKIP